MPDGPDHSLRADPLPLAGRRVLVTGASRGIGAAVARAAAAAGARIAVSARDGATLRKLAGEIRADGRAIAAACPADVTDGAAVERCVADAAVALGGLDSAVLCQGVNRLAPLREMTDAVWEEVLAVNLTGSFRLLRSFLRHATPPGAVVLVSSVSGLPGYRKFPGFAAYCASKRGVLGLAEVMDLEESTSGFRVYPVCPPGVDTAMFRESFPGRQAELTPGVIADRILGLLDGRSSPESGTVIEI